MENIKFVAFDVETASMKKPRFICQLGISIVNQNNEIVETKSFYIQPPNNEIAPQLTKIHGITSEDTNNAPGFDAVWNEIKHFFNNDIVAHNSSFDCSVLLENLEYNNLDAPSLSDCKCTYQMFNKRLDELCDIFSIDYTQHHNAGFDAECCAKFYIAYLKGLRFDETKSNTKSTSTADIIFGNEHRLKGDILKKDLSNADPDNFFYDKKVVITGVFDISRKELAQILKSRGADIDTAISKNTNFVLVGEKAGASKMKLIEKLQNEGCGIRIIRELELNDILKE